jgi:hypothetical protein
MTTHLTRVVTVLALLGWFGGNASAQRAATSPTDRDRWSPWMGCWQVTEESVQDAERVLEDANRRPAGRSAARVCVTPSPDGGVTLTTLVSQKPVLVETIIADGQGRPVSEGACRGTQTAEWSAIAPRVYARTEIACEGQPARVVSGMSAILAGPIWVDIQMIESEGRKGVRVRRYRPALNQEGADRSVIANVPRMPLGGRFTLADIKEASAKLPVEAVQAAVFEMSTSNGYELNAKRLIELDDAGVPDQIIDLMVAMSFPEKYVVERASGGYGGGYAGAWGGADPWDLAWGPYSMWSYYAHPLYYSSYYSPFGYSSWGYWNPYYYGVPGVIVVDPGNRPAEPSGNGRVVDGRGYTRIRPNVPEPAVRTGDGSGSTGGTAGATGSNGNSGSSSGGSVSTGGYSGGGSGGERVAVPRPPGGGK